MSLDYLIIMETIDEGKLQEFQRFAETVSQYLSDKHIDLVAGSESQPKEIPNVQNQFGHVELETFNKILTQYEVFQKSSDKKETPVMCDNIMGKNLGNHIHSRVGFHNLSSTSKLVRILKIRDSDRHSFLGGICDMTPRRGEHLHHLIDLNQGCRLGKHITQARALMEQHLMDQAKHELNLGFKIDPENVELIIIRGSLNFRLGQFEQAISDLNCALRKGVRDASPLIQMLIDIHHNLAFGFFFKTDYESASKHFREILRYDPNHQVAKIHLEMSQNNLNASRPRHFGEPPQQTRRR